MAAKGSVGRLVTLGAVREWARRNNSGMKVGEESHEQGIR